MVGYFKQNPILSVKTQNRQTFANLNEISRAKFPDCVEKFNLNFALKIIANRAIFNEKL